MFLIQAFYPRSGARKYYKTKLNDLSFEQKDNDHFGKYQFLTEISFPVVNSRVYFSAN